jgi:hypothetical protein
LCTARPAPVPTTPHLTELRRHLALRTRRLTDAGVFAPAPTPSTTPAPAPSTCRPLRPVVQLLYCRYLAAHPVEHIPCIVQSHRRHRCPHPVLNPQAPGTWNLLPTRPAVGQQSLPDVLMAVYDLTALPYREQLRWRTQRCPSHAAAYTAADLAGADWETFDPLLHHQHIATRLPTTVRHRAHRAHRGVRQPHISSPHGPNS